MPQTKKKIMNVVVAVMQIVVLDKCIAERIDCSIGTLSAHKRIELLQWPLWELGGGGGYFMAYVSKYNSNEKKSHTLLMYYLYEYKTEPASCCTVKAATGWIHKFELPVRWTLARELLCGHHCCVADPESWIADIHWWSEWSLMCCILL